MIHHIILDISCDLVMLLGFLEYYLYFCSSVCLYRNLDAYDIKQS